MMPSTQIRPPWPDELARLFDAFPRFPRTQSTRPLILVTNTVPERIVGYAVVVPAEDGVMLARFEVRARFLTTGEIERMIDAAVWAARAISKNVTLVIDDISEEQPWQQALERCGFRRQHSPIAGQTNRFVLAQANP
ncbi:MAG TPA: hypothetical protein VHD62_04615 [Opitutaceae bacterium]|nr:hypothetical protein [Opitutaceae bacterium]